MRRSFGAPIEAGGGLAKLARFATVGVLSTLAYAVLGVIFARAAGLEPVAASVAAWIGAAAFSYLAHRRVTFRSGRAHRSALPRFLTVNALGLGVAMGLSALGARLGLPVEAAIAATCVAVPALSFLLLDRFVFDDCSRGGPQ